MSCQNCQKNHCMENDHPLVSIIIPVYNSEKTLQACIESAIYQSYEHLEIIIVIDGSADNSFNIAKQYSRSDERIKIVDKTINEGLVEARKSGIAIATGKYIQYLDSDDTLCDKAIEYLVNRAEETNADIVISPFFFYINGQLNDTVVSKFDFMSGLDFLKLILRRKAYWSVWSKFHLRSLYDNTIERPKSSFGEDVILSTQLLVRSQKVVYFGKETINYYYSSNSMSNPETFNETKFNDFKLYSSWINGYMLTHGLYNEMKKDLALFHIFNSFALIYFWKRFKDFGLEVDKVAHSINQYPDLLEYLTKRERKIIKIYTFSKWLGYVNLLRYNWQGKL